jgi:integrase
MRGHIRRRGRNSFEIKYEVPREGGGRRTVYRTVKGSRREAAAELNRLQAQVASGGHVDSSKLTVSGYLMTRLAHWKASGVISPKTAERYEQLITGQIIPHIGSKLIQKLTTRDIEAWHTILRTRGRRGRKGLLDGQGGVSSRTIGHAHRILSKALREGVQHELVLRNVCTVQRPPKVGADKMPILTPAQVAAFPAKLDGHRHAAIAITALFTGMRRGELLATRWGNCDLEAEVIRVRESLEQTRSGLRFKEPKSAAGIRDIRLPAVVTDVLRAHRKQLLETRLVLGQGRLTDQDLVFPAWDGSPQQPNNFCSVWSKLARKLGFDIPFHGLRHTHASQLIHAGVDVVMIARRLGHSSPVITLRVYAHLFPQDDSKAAAAIDAALEK